MKIDIRYFTKSKKGNTKKIADFVSNKLQIEALDVSNNLEEKAETLILINAMYAANIDKEVKAFLEFNKENIGTLVNINSSAGGASTYKVVKKVCDANNINISDKEFHTVASWIFLNKGRPNDDDFNKLEIFLNQLFI